MHIFQVQIHIELSLIVLAVLVYSYGTIAEGLLIKRLLYAVVSDGTLGTVW